MKCPKCHSNFQKISYKGIEVDRCMECYGLWFDILEKRDLQAMDGSESIDIGYSEVGKATNTKLKIKCPECHVAMMQMIDKDQFHIHYEYCPTCYGTFFDAGEFRDLKQHTVIERFKQMLSTLRSNIS